MINRFFCQVQFPKLVTSYATPPQSSFSCSPCSVRQKDAQTSVTKRWTYCALDAPEKKIQCFLDESSDAQINQLKISTKTFKLARTESPVIALSAIPTTTPEAQENSDDFDVVAVHQDGRVRRLSPDLEVEKYSGYATAPAIEEDQKKSTTKYNVTSSFFISFEDAQKSLLKRRQDIIANVLQDGFASTILVVIQAPTEVTAVSPSDIRVNIFVLPAYKPASGTLGTSSGLKHLMTVTLPTPGGFKPLEPTEAHWDYSAMTGLLTLTFSAGVVNFDISQYSPQISSTLTFDEAKLFSSLRVSPQSLMAVRDSSVAIYNTRYQSVQAHVPLKDVLDVVPDRSKTGESHIEFVTYFAKLGLAVAVCGVTLLAFDLTPVQGKFGAVSRKHTRDGLLIHAIGRGIPASKGSLAPVPDQAALPENIKVDDVEQWNSVKAQLQACVNSKDSSKFDEIFAREFPKLTPGPEKRVKNMPSVKQFYDTDKIFFLLSRIFTIRRVSDSSEYQLAVSFLPPKTFSWLINASHLTFSNVKFALRQNLGLEAVPHLKPGAMLEAIIAAKPSLKYLNQILRGHSHLDADELVYTLQACLNIARKYAPAFENGEAPNAITEKPHSEDDASKNEASPSTAVVVKSNPSGSETILTNAVIALNNSLTRLESLPQMTVTSAIRAHLSNSDTLSIIHHLRHALATGGYTSRFVETGPAPFTHAKVPTLSLSTIVSSLTACIDAIGPSGWISAAAFADSADSEASLIADIKTEISAALAGVEEAAYLKGILREFIRYSETVQSSTTKQSQPEPKAITAPTSDALVEAGEPTRSKLKVKYRERHNDADIVVYETPDYAAPLLGPEDSQLLPLSLKKQDATQDVSKTKTHRGTGEVTKRSTREMGYLRRKAVGKYSFERIIV